MGHQIRHFLVSSNLSSCVFLTYRTVFLAYEAFLSRSCRVLAGIWELITDSFRIRLHVHTGSLSPIPSRPLSSKSSGIRKRVLDVLLFSSQLHNWDYSEYFENADQVSFLLWRRSINKEFFYSVYTERRKVVMVIIIKHFKSCRLCVFSAWRPWSSQSSTYSD